MTDEEQFFDPETDEALRAVLADNDLSGHHLVAVGSVQAHLRDAHEALDAAREVVGSNQFEGIDLPIAGDLKVAHDIITRWGISFAVMADWLANMKDERERGLRS